MAELTVIDLGRMAYSPAMEVQFRLVERLVGIGAGAAGEAYLLLVEHDPPVITRGRRGGEANLLASPAQLAREGVELHDTRRGGDVTYHGPGQLVGYPILALDRKTLSVHGHIRNLERAIIGLLERFGIEGRAIEGLTGVWVGDDPPAKVAAIGVAVRRWVAYHGFALNVRPDLSHFEWIVPCGIADKPVTSMARLLGRDVSVSSVRTPLVECIRDTYGFDTVRTASIDDLPAPHRPR